MQITYAEFRQAVSKLRRVLKIRGTIVLDFKNNAFPVWDKAPGIKGVLPVWDNDNHVQEDDGQ